MTGPPTGRARLRPTTARRRASSARMSLGWRREHVASGRNRFGRVMFPICGSSSNTISAGMNATRKIRYGNRRGCGRYWAIAPDTSGPSAPPQRARHRRDERCPSVIEFRFLLHQRSTACGTGRAHRDSLSDTAYEQPHRRVGKCQNERADDAQSECSNEHGAPAEGRRTAVRRTAMPERGRRRRRRR